MKLSLFHIMIAVLGLIFTYYNSYSEPEGEIILPAPAKSGGKPLMDALNARSSAREFSSKELSKQELSDLLWAANGINRPEIGKRTAPTARNWQDTEVWLVLRSGIYQYLPKEHKLILKKTGNYMKNTGKQDFVENAALNLVYVCDTSKMETDSKDDKLVYAGIHTGCIVQNVYLWCASAGLNTVTRRFVDIGSLHKDMELRKEQMIILAQTVGFKP
jgi:SagB-type dehydrogenase family enzyme